ncbi:hypothetical protein PV773_24160 [Mesorhizobium sp. CC13]|uniref:hypothetical protein n=1 Tax=Mesorhizobium sp. CC13 TaxID=3029194 RepID=UPI003267A9FB
MNALFPIPTPTGFHAATARAVAALAAARKLPLRVICLGEARYLEGDHHSSAYSAPRTVTLTECDSLDSTIATVERLARQDRIEIGDDSAVGFLPRLFIVHDDEQCQVLAGEPCGGTIRWCDPVASDGEARRVVETASRLRGEASIEAASNNHDAARTLRFRASVLEGRLVHPDWRSTARAALLAAA